MADNPIRFRRRAAGGIAGAPGYLENAEPAFNEVDNVLYIGIGTGGSGGSATSIIPIAGPGATVMLTGTQDVDGPKTFLDPIVGSLVGNAASASKLVTGRNIALTGDVTGSVFFDGSGNVAIDTTLQNTIVKDLSDLLDVTSALPQAGHLLRHNGTQYVNTLLVSSDIPNLPAGRVTSGTFSNARISQLNVTQHEAALTIGHAQISDFDIGVQANRLDDMALPTGVVSFNGQRITNLAQPIADSDGASKVYVDNLSQGLASKPSVIVATTGNIALNSLQTIDGHLLTANQRVLVKNQSNSVENGIYEAGSGNWQRAPDFDDSNEDNISSAFVFVEQGDTHHDTGWTVSTQSSPTVGVDPIEFVQFSSAGLVEAGAGLSKIGNTLLVNAGNGLENQVGVLELEGQVSALHTMGVNGFFVRTDVDTVTARAIAVSGDGIAIANGNAVSGNPTVSLNTPLQVLSTLVPASNKLPYFTGAGTASLTSLTALGRTLMGGLTTAAMRTTLDLGSMAIQAANAVAITGGSIDSVALNNTVIDGGTF